LTPHDDAIFCNSASLEGIVALNASFATKAMCASAAQRSSFCFLVSRAILILYALAGDGSSQSLRVLQL